MSLPLAQAYLEQARADYSSYTIIRQAPHQRSSQWLHLLQMTLEKMAKALSLLKTSSGLFLRTLLSLQSDFSPRKMTQLLPPERSYQWDCTALWFVLRAAVASRAALVAENLALQHQLLVLQRSAKRPKLCPFDRLFWVCLSELWPNWRSALKIFQPDTVVKWHQQGFKLYWRWLSKSRHGGRPPIDPDVRDLIRRMARDNPTWGAARIQSALRLLGYTVAQATVAKYMPKTRTPPSQTWRTFLANHLPDIAAIDFFTVHTLTFGVLYGFLVLRHEQRQVVHFNLTAHPIAQWTAQQIVEAFPFDEKPRFLLRDRDQIYGTYFRRRVTSMGIEEVIIAPRSPWQNPSAERMIGTLRRELLDRVIVLNEVHLRRLMTSYLEYYHTVRPHLALRRNAPIPRLIQGPSEGKVVSMPHVGGLYQGYRRAA